MIVNRRFLILIVVLNFICQAALAQPKNPDIEKIATAYTEAFNKGAIDEFRVLFDADMKQRNSLEKLKKNFDTISAKIGAIRTFTLDKEEGRSFTYRSQHQRLVTLKVVFELNSRGLVSRMLIDSNYTYKNAPVLERNTSDLILPFNEEWYVFWGGKKLSDNYHNEYINMQGAYDFWVMGSNGKSHKNRATKNEDFYAFGKEIITPVDATVIYTFDEIPDNKWPAMNSTAGAGNVVLLETINKEYILLGHLQQNSIKVKQGQKVKQGELLGLCGNSGNSTEPHLHFQMQNLPDFTAATGAWVHFKKIKVHGKVKEDYVPVRGDKIRN